MVTNDPLLVSLQQEKRLRRENDRGEEYLAMQRDMKGSLNCGYDSDKERGILRQLNRRATYRRVNYRRRR
jgi:hypothetical protein